MLVKWSVWHITAGGTYVYHCIILTVETEINSTMSHSPTWMSTVHMDVLWNGNTRDAAFCDEGTERRATLYPRLRRGACSRSELIYLLFAQHQNVCVP
jgi:hypothetical protein